MKITLENISLNDANKIKAWKADKDLCQKIMSNPVNLTIEEAQNWITKNTNDKNQLLKGIYLRESNNIILVGIVRLMFIDFESRNAEIGIYIGDTSYYGKGIGKIALGKIIFLGFEKFRLIKLFAKIIESNNASIKLFLSKGFIIEGVLRDEYLNPVTKTYENVFICSLFIN